MHQLRSKQNVWESYDHIMSSRSTSMFYPNSQIGAGIYISLNKIIVLLQVWLVVYIVCSYLLQCCYWANMHAAAAAAETWWQNEDKDEDP